MVGSVPMPVLVSLGGIALLVLAGLSLARPKMGLVLFGGALVIAGLHIAVVKGTDQVIPRWTDPVAARRSEIFAALSLVLGALVVFQGPVWYRLRFCGPVIALLAIALYQVALRLLVHSSASDAALNLALTLATVPTLYLAALRQMAEPSGLRRLLITLLLGGYVWVALSFVQFARAPDQLLLGGRFMGLFSNPQHAGTFSAVMITMSAWLAAYGSSKRGSVVFLVAATGFGLLLLWTGSRTSMLMTVAGLSVVLLPRIGRSVALVPIGGLALMGLMALADRLNIELHAGRLTTLSDTRSVSWLDMWASFRASPLVGQGPTAMAENSYLAGAAGWGIGMVVLIAGLMGAIAYAVWRAWVLRWVEGEESRAAAMLVIAFFVSWSVGAMFEAYLFARATGMLVLFLVMCAVYSRYFVAGVEARAVGVFDEEEGAADHEGEAAGEGWGLN